MEGLNCLLDTSVFIEYFRARDKAQTTLVRLAASASAAMSSVTLMELEFGTRSSGHREFLTRLLGSYLVLPFDQACAETAGELYRDLRDRNELIEVRDLMIAAAAVTNGLPLATLDRDHFGRISRLQFANGV